LEGKVEAYLWLDSNGHGKNGAPYRMRDVLDDMEEAEKMIETLLDAIKSLPLNMSFPVPSTLIKGSGQTGWLT